jgi:hypothetical protein
LVSKVNNPPQPDDFTAHSAAVLSLIRSAIISLCADYLLSRRLLANPCAACGNSDGETNCSHSFIHAEAIP